MWARHDEQKRAEAREQRRKADEMVSKLKAWAAVQVLCQTLHFLTSCTS